jgi:hypothetical protein
LIISDRIAFRPPWIKSIIAIAAAGFLLTLSGCASRDNRSELHPYQTTPFQENSVDLSKYKSPQSRLFDQDPNTAFAIAISGGGHRATNFGVGVLIELENIKNANLQKTNALNEIDYFSTVSGGGLAAAAYISSLHDHIYFNSASSEDMPEYSFAKIILNCDHSSDENKHSMTDCPSDPMLKKHLAHSYHKDLLDGLFSLTRTTRGEFLERAFDNEILGRRWRNKKLQSTSRHPARYPARDPSLTLGDIFICAEDQNKPVTLPYWIANATVYENGSIFPFTPDFLKLFMICGYKHRLKDYLFDPEKQTYESFINGVPLALGLTASGNLPVLIPATTLQSTMDPKNPYLHLLDGGMADNLGIITALRVLAAEKTKRRMMIVVDAYKENAAPFSNTASPPIMANTAIRTMAISLDSWRGRAHEIVKALNTSDSYGPNIKTVFISFDDLRDLATFEELFKFGLTQDDLDSLRKDGWMDDIIVNPYNLIRTVKTRYKVSPAQQNLLIAAGRYITNKKATQIKKHLNW